MSEALYRKYRSMDFDAMVGQDHVVNLLKQQVARGELSHAYVFSGTRGTGKTSAAKILSRAVNCLQPRDGNPCNECASCKGILSGQILDVVEMDAASHNGVDDIRELRAKAVYPPAAVKYRVYIIDEAHMLSKEAFNALLKILEEPPAHLIFILATTEPERIPPTILSRCQRYDFHRMTEEKIVGHMKAIVRAEGRAVETSVLELISRHADGAMRDALSMLDQCISLSGASISLEEALAVLGMVGHERMGKLYEALYRGDGPAVLRMLRAWRQEGKDSQAILGELIYFNRQWLMATVDGTQDDVLSKLVKPGDFQRVVRQLEGLLDLQGKIKLSPTPDVLLDVTLLQTMPTLYAEQKKSPAYHPTGDMVRQKSQLTPGKPSIPKEQGVAVDADPWEDEVGDRWMPFDSLEDRKQPSPSMADSAPESMSKVETNFGFLPETKRTPKVDAESERQEPKKSLSADLPEKVAEELEGGGSWHPGEWEAFLDYLGEHAPATKAALSQAKPKHKFADQLVIGYPQAAKIFVKAISDQPIHTRAMEEAAKALWNKDYTVRIEMLGLTEAEETDLAIEKVVRKFGRGFVQIED